MVVLPLFHSPDPKIPGGTHSNNNKKVEPFINVTVANKLATKLFHSIIDKYKYPYEIDTHGYQWEKLDNMMKEHGLTWSLNRLLEIYIFRKIFTSNKKAKLFI